MIILARVLSATIAVAATVTPLHASEVAATVGGETITVAELDRAATARLLRVRTAAYEVRRAEIEKRVAELVLRKRAAADNLKPEEWLAREVAKRDVAVTPEEVAAAYETLTTVGAATSKEEAMTNLARDMRTARGLHAEQEILQELRATANVQLRLEPPRLDRHDLGGAAVHGPDDAAVTMVVFQDFQCPRCASLVPVLEQLRERYPEKLRILHRDFPLANHPQAKAAAEAAACAAEQDRFWEYSAALYSNQQSLTRATFEKLAGDTGVDRTELASCLDSGRQTRSWKDGLATARELDLRGTPAIFINGRLVMGARDYDAYAAIIEEELRTSF